VEDCEDVLNPANTTTVLNMVLSTINNNFEQECLDEAVRLLNAHLIRQLTDDRFPDQKYLIPGLVHQVWAILFIVWRWVWDADMPGALVADKMGLGKTFTLVAAAMLCNLVTENNVMRLPLSILWGNTLEEWVICRTMTFPALSVKNRSGINSRD
jgi:hypothetical protein